MNVFFFSDKTIFRLWVRCYTYFWHQKLFDHFLQSLGNTLLCRFLGPNSQIFYGLHSSSLRCSRQTNDFGVAGGLAIIKNPINLIAENATFIIIYMGQCQGWLRQSVHVATRSAALHCAVLASFLKRNH